MCNIDWSKAPHWADRVVLMKGTECLCWANDDQCEMIAGQKYGYVCSSFDPIHIRNNWEVVERRPELASKMFNPHHTHSIPSTIEQRIASLRALEKQVEETRAELTRDLEALGLTWMVRDEPEQPTITDWRDLRVGDVVEYVSGGQEWSVGMNGTVSEFDEADEYQHVKIKFTDGRTGWPDKWRFIRRP